MQLVNNLHNLFSQLPKELAQTVEKKLQPARTYAAGTILYQAGDVATMAYQIVEGEVNIGNMSHDGKELVLNVMQPGDLFGEASIIDGLPRANHAIAASELTVKGISKKDFLELYHQHPEFCHHLLLMAYQRFHILMNRASDAYLLGLPNRLVRIIESLYYSRSKKSEDGQSYIDISHEELGAMVAASRQSTNKELKVLEQEGLLQMRYGKIFVTDIEALSDKAKLAAGYEGITPTYLK